LFTVLPTCASLPASDPDRVATRRCARERHRPRRHPTRRRTRPPAGGPRRSG